MATESGGLVSPPPIPKCDSYATVAYVPSWVMPTMFSILHGTDAAEANNQLGMDVAGRLVLYRKISPEYVEKHPGLIGIDEVWIVTDITADEDS